MKKILLAALCVCFSAISFAQSDLYFGVKAGGAANWIPGTTTDPDDVVKTNFGFYGGAILGYDISPVSGIQAELLYSRKGITTKGEIFQNKYTRNIHYLQLPVMFSMRFADDKCRMLVGPEFAYALGYNIKSDAVYDPAVADNVRKFNFAVALQLSYFVIDELSVDLKFERAFTKTFTGSDGGCNTSVMLGLSYFFDL